MFCNPDSVGLWRWITRDFNNDGFYEMIYRAVSVDLSKYISRFNNGVIYSEILQIMISRPDGVLILEETI